MPTNIETETGTRIETKQSSNRPVVLLVEDEQPIRDIIVPWLFRNGFSCREAADGQAAIELLKSGARFSAVLSNLLLPLVDGYALLLYVRQHHPKIPFGVVTAVHDISVRDAMMSKGAAGYLLKPFTEDEFLGFLGQVLGN